MFRSLRTARAGQTVLWIATLCAIVGSFGLHPEPRIFTSPVVSAGGDWTTPAPIREPSHGCAACLAHRAVTLAGLSGTILEPDSVVRESLSFDARPLCDLGSAPNDGRAPPASL